MTETAAVEGPVTLSPSAARRILQLAANDGPGVFMRVAVTGGGCSGFQYNITLDNALTGDDLVVERDGAKVAIDPTSVDYMKGAVIDFVEDMIGASFQIKNPNAVSGCGCGNSFSLM